MVLGRTRPRLRADVTRLFAIRPSPVALQPAESWASERGAVLFEATVDIAGGFPGYADRGCLLSGVQFRVTERYVLVDEGDPHGFGLPLTWLDGTTLVEQPGREDYALRLFYRAGGQARLFTARFRSGRVGSRGARRSVRAQEVLHEAGLVDRYADEPPLEPNFTLPWDQTRDFEQENVIWTGRANAPICVGAESAPSEIWLTTRSLIWGSGDGDGINRIPLPLLMDLVSTRLRDRLGTPVVYLAIGDETTGRYELPFAFNVQTPPDRNFRERGAFLVGLRSRGLRDGETAPYSQPWRSTLLSLDHDETTSDSRAWTLPEPAVRVQEEHLAPTFVEPDADEPVAERPHNISVFHERRRATPPTLGGFGRRLLAQPRPPADQPLPPPEFIRANVSGGPNLEGGKIPLTSADRDDERADPTERFAVVFDASAAPSMEPLADDILLAEWTPGSDPPDIDFALSQSWAAPSINPTAASHDHSDPVTDTAEATEPALQPNELPVNPFSVPAGLPSISPGFQSGERHEPPSDAPIDTSNPDPWSAVRAYEESAVGALAEVLREIDDRVAGHDGGRLSEQAPSSRNQARALTELSEMVLHGAMSVDDALRRKERLITLGEVCVRLRTLIELHGNGILATEDLDAKRARLVQSLSAALVRVASPGSGSDVT